MNLKRPAVLRVHTYIHACMSLDVTVLSRRLFPVFTEILRSNQLSGTDKEELVLLTCLLLPERHLLTLKVLYMYMYTHVHVHVLCV